MQTETPAGLKTNTVASLFCLCCQPDPTWPNVLTQPFPSTTRKTGGMWSVKCFYCSAVNWQVLLPWNFIPRPLAHSTAPFFLLPCSHLPNQHPWLLWLHNERIWRAKREERETHSFWWDSHTHFSFLKLTWDGLISGPDTNWIWQQKGLRGDQSLTTCFSLQTVEAVAVLGSLKKIRWCPNKL